MCWLLAGFARPRDRGGAFRLGRDGHPVRVRGQHDDVRSQLDDVSGQHTDATRKHGTSACNTPSLPAGVHRFEQVEVAVDGVPQVILGEAAVPLCSARQSRS
jgi:hypothetical protein